MQLIAIGDIHGHSDALAKLLRCINPQPGDEFVFLGDYIDRGPDSKGVVDMILKLGESYPTHCVMGNHDEMLIASTLTKAEYKFWLKFGGAQTLQSYGINQYRDKFDVLLLPPAHAHFYAYLLPYYETDQFIFVHAAYHPNVPMDKQSPDNLRWVRLPPDLPPHYSGKRVYCGHSSDRTIKDFGHVVCLDTGCGVLPHGRLTAVDVLIDSWDGPTAWQIPCK